MRKTVRRVALAVLITLLVGLMPSVAFAAPKLLDTSKIFEDVAPKAWYKQAVDYAVTHGMFTGTSKTTFEPDTKVDRAMFVTVLARLDGAKVNNKVTTKFSDVPKKQWYTGSVQWAVERGIVNGTSPTTFAPNTAISREQLCAMIVRYADYKDIALLKKVKKVAFADDKDISSYARKAVYACQQAGIVNGVSATHFDPAATGTRAQAAKILMIFHQDYMTVTEATPKPEPKPEPEPEPKPEPEPEPEQPEVEIDMVNKIKLEKFSSHRTAQTVSPEGVLSYTVTVQNDNAASVNVTVTDALPEGTAFVGGDGTLTGNTLTFEGEVPTSGSIQFCYSVKVDADATVIAAPAATLGMHRSAAPLNYVARTLGETDRDYMAQAIKAHAYSDRLEPVSLLRRMYYIAFTAIPSLRDTTALNLDYIFEGEVTDKGTALRQMVVPTLYGGKNVIAENFTGESALPVVADLMEGDVVMSRTADADHLYIYDGNTLYCLDNNCVRVDAEAVLAGLSEADRYAVLRPSMGMNESVFFKDGESEELTKAQQALLATAKAYIARGMRVQYDDTRMTAAYPSTADRGEYRWQIGKYQPEDYTAENWGYLNCAGFTFDIYRTALGQDLEDLYTTEKQAAYYVNGGTASVPLYPYHYKTTTSATPAERLAVEKEFFDTLEVGDLVVIRRNDGNGHVMIYIGNDTVVHSTGSSFDYSGDKETFEPTIRYLNLRHYLFNKTEKNYIFAESGYVKNLSIVRPLDTFNGSIPENTLNRINNMEDVFAEKLSGYGQGGSVSKGENITFTFRIENRGDGPKTLTVTDTVPAGTALSSAEGATVEGDDLTYSVTLGAHEVKEVSYTVTVTGDNGSVVESINGKVGGVLHTCPSILIGNTLSPAQQSALQQAVKALQASNPDALKSTALINEIYTRAGLSAPFVSGGSTVSESSLRSSLFAAGSNAAGSSSSSWTLKTSSAYYDMVAPTMYGGRRFFTPQRYTATTKVNTDRNRMPREIDLIVGDILMVKFQSSEAMYLYVGDGKFVNLSTLKEDNYTVDTRLMRMLSAYNYYAVLRPTLVK